MCDTVEGKHLTWDTWQDWGTWRGDGTADPWRLWEGPERVVPKDPGPSDLSDSSSWSHSLVQLSHCFFLSLLFLSKRWSLQSPPSRWETWGRRVTASVASMDWSKEITAGTGRRNKRENACSQIPRASLWEEQESNRCACRRVCKRVFLRI